MKDPVETNTLFNALRQSAKPEPVSAIEKLIRDGGRPRAFAASTPTLKEWRPPSEKRL